MPGYKIFIPSYKRSDVLLNKKATLTYFNDELLENTYLVVRDGEASAYRQVCTKFPGLRLLQLSDLTKGIPETRDQILSYAQAVNLEYAIVMDDDLRFAKRETMSVSLKDQTKSDFWGMLYEFMYYCSSEHPLVGIAHRGFANSKIDVLSYNTRIIQVYYYHVPTIAKSGVQYQDLEIPFMTDYYFTMKLLTLGYKNIVLNRYTRDDSMQSKGGCSETRTIDEYNRCAKTLALYFKPNCTAFYKTGGSWSPGQQKIDLRFNWKKAFNKKLFNDRLRWDT